MFKWLKTLTTPKLITLNVIEEDFENAGTWCSSGTCLLATALRRQLNTKKNIIVWRTAIMIDGIRYEMEYEFSKERHDMMMKVRKPFTIQLTRP
jgi:hypothetical protein